ncbi:MAG: alpha/beta hydrolase [Oscillospiraceae bacterium]
MEHFDVEGRSCWSELIGAENAKPVLLLWPGGEAAELEEMAGLLQIPAGKSLLIVGFASEDWNADFSPWPAKAVFAKGGDFVGRAAETLNWIQQALLPAVATRAETEPGRRMILGYSLAGLFALWATAESGLFTDCACCSGSLWFEGWGEYLEQHIYPDGTRIYLSLGRGEEKTRNPRMALVGERTRQTHSLLEESPQMAETILEWHDGGHFQEVPKRLAAAVNWLVK